MKECSHKLPAVISVRQWNARIGWLQLFIWEELSFVAKFDSVYVILTDKSILSSTWNFHHCGDKGRKKEFNISEQNIKLKIYAPTLFRIGFKTLHHLLEVKTTHFKISAHEKWTTFQILKRERPILPQPVTFEGNMLAFSSI